MEKLRVNTIIYFLSFELMIICHGIEMPPYTVVHSEQDFEIRLYRESNWMSAPVRDASFENSTKYGFHRLYQYINGANLNSSRLKITAPILTSITQSVRGYECFIRFYLSANYDGTTTPRPNPELNLQIQKWRSNCMAVKKFAGFAKDDTINKEKEALVASIHNSRKTAVLNDQNSYTVAQYNASWHLSGRLNEVWMSVLGFSAEGCPSYQGKY